MLAGKVVEGAPAGQHAGFVGSSMPFAPIDLVALAWFVLAWAGYAITKAEAQGAGNSSRVRPVSQYTSSPLHSRAAVSLRRKPSPTE